MGFSENFIIFGGQTIALFAAIWFGMRIQSGNFPRFEMFDRAAFASFATITIALFFNGA